MFKKSLESSSLNIFTSPKSSFSDNIYIERLWRILKKAYIYICPAEDGNTLIKGMK
jgi:hypothetical protein